MPIDNVPPTGEAPGNCTVKETINDENKSHTNIPIASKPQCKKTMTTSMVTHVIDNNSPSQKDAKMIVNIVDLITKSSQKQPNESEDSPSEVIKQETKTNSSSETETSPTKNMEDDGKLIEVVGNETTTVTRVYPSNYIPPVKADETTQTRPKRKYSHLEVKEEDSLSLKHPSSLAKFKKIDDDNEKDFLEACNEYLEKLSMFKCRKAREKKTITECHCLKDIYSHEGTVSKVKSLILAHTRRPKGLQGLFIKDWIRMAGVVKSLRPRGQKKKPCFSLLGVHKEGRKDKPFFVCSNGFCCVLGIGSSRWEGLKNRIDSYEEEIHGLSGKEPNRKMDIELTAALNAYFEARMKDAEARKGKNNKVKYRLPIQTSKRKEYQRFCWTRGWKAKATKTGDYGPLKDFKLREEFEEGWVDGTKPICSWSKFKDYWTLHFPDLIINNCAEPKKSIASSESA